MSGSKGHILVVDDNEYNRDLLVQDLEDSGYEVSTAVNGMEALSAVERQLPAMILLDIMMPGLSGLQVCQMLRQRARTRDVPIIMVTAKSDTQDVVAGLKAGANDYVTKPIDFDILMARMETHLRLRRLQDENTRQSARIVRDLTAARAVQESLLPAQERLDDLPKSYGLRVAAMWKPSETLGGDFWDIVSLVDGSLGIALLDFAGTGVVPALNTFRLKTFLQGQCPSLYNAALTMARLNAHLIQITGEYELATALYARYNPDRCQFTVACAGAPPPLVYRCSTSSVEAPRVAGLPVGAFAEAGYEEASAVLEMGDKILLATDGVMKSTVREGEPYSLALLRDIFARHGQKQPREILDRLEAELDALGDPNVHRDDMTVVIAEVVN